MALHDGWEQLGDGSDRLLSSLANGPGGGDQNGGPQASEPREESEPTTGTNAEGPSAGAIFQSLSERISGWIPKFVLLISEVPDD
jgi:hypothetical protein